jgi:hypothetical protein
MRPDIDYHWTRFGISDERAIYRLAHIKLANPRRELYSQVLLSNFMYSYLAKVQQMHPQIQIPQSAAQKQAQRQERQAQAKQQEEERKAQQQEMQAPGRAPNAQSAEELAQYQRYQEVSVAESKVGIINLCKAAVPGDATTSARRRTRRRPTVAAATAAV